MVADYKTKMFLQWIVIAFVAIYNVQTDGRVLLKQNLTWFRGLRTCYLTEKQSDMICVSNQINLTTVAQYLIENQMESIWVKDNAIIQYNRYVKGCITREFATDAFNKSCDSSCNCSVFCAVYDYNFSLKQSGKCYCFNALPTSYYTNCSNNNGCNNCKNGNYKPLVYRSGADVKYCRHITIKNGKACIEQTDTCNQTRPVLCDEAGAIKANCGVKFVTHGPTSKANSIITCVDVNEQNVVKEETEQESQTTNNESSTSSGSIIVPIVAVVAVLAVVTIILVAAILIHKRRKRPKSETRVFTNRELPNNTKANLYTIPSNEDNYQCASEYDYIKESDINQNAKYDKNPNNQYEASNNLGNNYFILEPQDKSRDQMATGADDDGEYVDKVEGDYHHLNETTERKDAISKEDNLYDHGQNNKGSDGTYDTTNTIKDNIDVSEYNTIDSVKDDGTYNKLA